MIAPTVSELRFGQGLIAGIDSFTGNWNAGATPFAWVKTADETLAKAVRKRPAIFRITTLAAELTVHNTT